MEISKHLPDLNNVPNKWGSELQGHVGNVYFEGKTQTPRPWSWSSTPGCWRESNFAQSLNHSLEFRAAEKQPVWPPLYLCIPLFIHSFKERFSRSHSVPGTIHAVIQRCEAFPCSYFVHPQEMRPFPNKPRAVWSHTLSRLKTNQPCSITPTIP